ncbi:hypothetical protein GCM10010965_20540 [Caldalkalibacillus thermarum]|uniref:ABC transporter ATP-binding protein n=1 Tax=Caldalkalibacillus thermarum TaxID=296745 RepID=UPI0016676CA8|nr:ABC transporter ATP-binding protein [Caldalkalibacillus thermarum]GGK27618.1 hypothetical protein GCM10010965_20540 [Caldalkalibacillus thermarum]
MSEQPCLVIKNVSKRYRSGRFVLRNINLQVPQGYVCGIVGAPGTGKTTLTRLLGGLIRPTKGEICIFGQNIAQDTPYYRQLVSCVLHDSALYPKFKVKDLLRWLQRLYRHWDEKRCYSLVRGFEIPLNRKVNQLSKEKHNWLSLIIALSARPKLMIVDEPGKELSPAEKREMLKLLAQDVVNHGTTIVFTTSIEDEIREFADYGFRLEAGQLFPCELKKGVGHEAYMQPFAMERMVQS